MTLEFQTDRERRFWWSVYRAALAGMLADTALGDVSVSDMDNIASEYAAVAFERYKSQNVRW